MKRRKKPTKKDLLKTMRGGDVTDRLYAAVSDYVENKGGDITVIGGVEIQEWPGESNYKFRVAIHCLGKKPIREQGK